MTISWGQYKTPMVATKKERQELARHGQTPKELESENKLGFEKFLNDLDLQKFIEKSEHSEIGLQSLEIFWGCGSWIASGKPTVFCESAILANMLIRSDIVDFQTLIQFCENHSQEYEGTEIRGFAYAVSYPDNMTINGFKARPQLIVYDKGKIVVHERRGYMDSKFYPIYSDTDWTNTQPIIDNVLNEASEEVRKINAAFEVNAKLSVKLLYYSLLEDKSIDGLPEEMKQRNRKHFKGCHNVVALQPKRTHNSPEIHWRNGHFRTLKDERYKRDKNGFPKIIFVKGTVVGKAKTAVA